MKKVQKWIDIAIFSSPLSKGQIIPEGGRGEFRSSVERKEERTTRKKRTAVEEHTLRMREKETRARVVDDTTTGARVQPVVAWGGERGGKGKSETSSLETGALLANREEGRGYVVNGSGG